MSAARLSGVSIFIVVVSLGILGCGEKIPVVINAIQRARPGAKANLKEGVIIETPETSEKATPSSGK